METSFDIPVCTCSRSEIRVRTDAGGHTHYVRQCLNCGREVERIKKSTLLTTPETPWDDLLREAWYTLCDEYRRAHYEERERERQLEWEAGEPERRRQYQEYLNTPHWQEMSLKCLERDRYTCQICGKRATEAHHLTYQHRGCEYLFELVSLCRLCHIAVYHASRDGYYD